MAKTAVKANVREKKENTIVLLMRGSSRKSSDGRWKSKEIVLNFNKFRNQDEARKLEVNDEVELSFDKDYLKEDKEGKHHFYYDGRERTIEIAGRASHKSSDGKDAAEAPGDVLEEGVQEQAPDVSAKGDEKTPENRKYDPYVIMAALTALPTSQIMILHGRPGVGKSTFAGDLAKLLGAEFTLVPVQSNWTDSDDLLGYYDAMNKVFRATDFLETLLRAKGNPEKLHLICLDEMNLARAEYYFATFLSVIQQEDKEIKPLNFRLSEDEKKALEDQYNGTDYDVNDIVDGFVLPDNVRFIGTINMDDTTQPLSPKVIDRSFFIKFGGPWESDEKKGQFQRMKLSDWKGHVTWESLRKAGPLAAGKEEEVFGSEDKSLEGWLGQVAPDASWRLKKYAKEMLETYCALSEISFKDLKKISFKDLIAIGKLLPALPDRRRKNEGEGDEDFTEVHGDELTIKYKTDMSENANKCGVLTYFYE